MDTKLYLFCTVCAVTACFLYVNGQTSCQNSFVSSLYQCLGNRSLDRENFLWLARNGQLGTEPRDVQAFTSRVCIEKSGLYLCVKTALDNSLALSDTQCPQTQKTSLVTLFKNIFKTVNKKCEHPCRATFKDSLAKCYTDENFTSMSYQLFNITAKRDAILGTNSSEIDSFCQARSKIIQCMKVAALQCNDSPFLFKSFSLDLESLNASYTILCNFTKVYEDSTECYKEPSVPIIQCRNTLSTKVAKLESEFEDLNTTESLYRSDLCRLRIEQIQCEMKGIAAQSDTEKCNDVIVGLRRQEECALMPRECIADNQNALNLLCKMSEFNIPDRQFYKTSAADLQSLTLGLVMASVLASLVTF